MRSVPSLARFLLSVTDFSTNICTEIIFETFQLPKAHFSARQYAFQLLKNFNNDFENDFRKSLETGPENFMENIDNVDNFP